MRWVSVEHLQVCWLSVVGGLLVSGWLSVGRWSTCRWVGGRLSVVGGSVEDLSVSRWSVVNSLSVVGGFVIRQWDITFYYSLGKQRSHER